MSKKVWTATLFLRLSGEDGDREESNLRGNGNFCAPG